MLERFVGLAVLGFLLCGTSACDTDDSIVEGAHGECAFGGAQTTCPDAERTSEGACWRLVDCGAIPLEHKEDGFDWGVCVDVVDAITPDRRRSVLACVATSSCDELRAGNLCIEIGDS